jgi:glycolate oxidase subunit GlcD
MSSSKFLEELLHTFPKDAVTTEKSELEEYGRDWTRVYNPAPCVVVFPGSTEDVVRIVKLCDSHNMPIVPSGGRTGLSGGAVASKGEVVLNFRRMRRMDPVDCLAQTVRVQAGAVTQMVHDHCAKHGLTWPIDFASKGSSQIGGNISTNAGGVKVIRYGLTRHWVLGLQVVTAHGEVLELNGSLEKNQTGLDLRQIFIGSEGTLGIITEATLKLTRLSRESDVFFFSLNGVHEVLNLFLDSRAQDFTINAFEMLGDNCLESVIQHRKLSRPLPDKAPYYVLLEVERPASESAKQRLETWLASLFELGAVRDGVLAQSSEEARKLWELREGISESLAARYVVHKHDIALPISRLNAFIDKFLQKLGESYGSFEIFLFGHIGDGNMHVNIAKPEKWTKEAFFEACKNVETALFQLVHDHEGSISAEHGIGLLKKSGLKFSRTENELACMRAVKKAFDPKGLLNPGKIFD